MEASVLQTQSRVRILIQVSFTQIVFKYVTDDSTVMYLHCDLIGCFLVALLTGSNITSPQGFEQLLPDFLITADGAAHLLCHRFYAKCPSGCNAPTYPDLGP